MQRLEGDMDLALRGCRWYRWHLIIAYALSRAAESAKAFFLVYLGLTNCTMLRCAPSCFIKSIKEGNTAKNLLELRHDKWKSSGCGRRVLECPNGQVALLNKTDEQFEIDIGRLNESFRN